VNHIGLFNHFSPKSKDMNKKIESIRNPRKLLIELTKELSTEQLNEVPAGFNNNIIWNVAHLISAQEGVCYKRSGLELKTGEIFFQSYRPGTKPEGFVDSDEVEKIKTLLLSTLDELEADYDAGIFKNYTSVVTRYGIEIADIEDAINFLPFHEGLHMGCIVALKRLVSQ
jgi:DinB superfamily